MKIINYTVGSRPVQYDVDDIDEFIRRNSFIDPAYSNDTIEQKLSLKSLKRKLVTESQLQLTELDEKIIDRVWTKIVLEYWLEFAVSSWKSQINNHNDFGTVQKHLESLRTKNFWDIHVLRNHPLQKVINNNYEIFDEDSTNVCLQSFNDQCLSELLEQNKSIAHELQFLSEFIRFLKENADKNFITKYQAEILRPTTDPERKFRELLLKVMKNQSESQLSTTAKTICEEKHFYLSSQFFDIAKRFFESMKVKIYKLDDIVVAMVTGSAYSLSDLWNFEETNIESEDGLDMDDVEEFHLISHVSLDIDTDFCRPGTNLVIKTARLTSSNEAVIDVSGKDNEHVYHSTAGTDRSGNGCDGRDGLAGNSAGNVWIEAEQIDTCPTIIANGGNGSKGQDGGNGKDGEDGEGMTTNTLKELFPPAAAYILGRRSDRVQRIVDNLNENLSSVLEAWWSGVDANTYHGVWENIKNKRGTFLGMQTRTLYQNESIYLRIKLKSGKLVTFAFECGGHLSWTNCQSYMLVEGTDGTMGTAGGSAGRGGKGGFPGSISINQSISSGNAGEDGPNGERGKHGTNGKNGWDVGWFDYSVSNAFGATAWPKDYGGNQNSKLELKPFKSSNQNRIFCPYRNSQNYANCMMEMYGRTLEHPKQRETSSKFTKEGNMEHHAVATRKSNVRVDVARELYSDQFSVVEQIMTSLQHNYRVTCENISKSVMLELHQTEVKADTAVNLQVEFVDTTRIQKKHSARPSLQVKITKPSWTNTEQMYFVKLFNLLNKMKISEDEINKMVPPKSCDIHQAYFTQAKNTSTQFRQFVAYFASSEPQEFVEGFRKLSKKKERENNFTTYLHVVREFVLEIGPIATEQGIKELYQEYQRWLERAKKNLIVFEESLRPIDKKCLKNKELMKQFDKHLKTKRSITSNCHVELFAQMFEYNIEIYHQNQNDGFVLSKNFNRTAKRTMRVLKNSNGQIKEQLKQDYLRFTFERRQIQKALIYNSVLSELLRFSTTQELCNYERRNGFMFTKPLLSQKYKAFAEHFDVKKAINDITSLVPDDEFSMNRLQFLTEPYIATNRILKALRDRLCSEGGQISSTELSFLVNTVLRLIRKTTYSEELILWIITAHDQREWTLECTLLQMENFFHRSFAEDENVRTKLRSVDDKQVLLLMIEKMHQTDHVTIESITSIINALQKTTTTSVLVNLSLSEWPYALKLGYWIDRLEKLAKWKNEEDLERISQFIPTIESKFSETLLEQLFDVFDKQKSRITSSIIMEIFRAFYTERCFLNSKFIVLLESHPVEKWLSELVIGSTKARTLPQLLNIIDNNSKISEAAKSRLTIVSDVITRAGSMAKTFFKYSQENIIEWSKNYHVSKTSLEETLAVIDRAIYLKENFALRETQKLAIVMFYAGGEDSRVLEQVSTGEGKSLIVVSIAIIKALRGEKVDVITSSSVLAKRDAESNVDLFSMFGLSVSHNCSESLTERMDAYGKNDVIYGEISNFQRDFLLDRFYGKNIFGNRRFENLVVDEVDSMLLDKGNNVLYLSHQIAAFDKLEVVFLYIWQLVNRPVKSQDEYDIVLSNERLRDNVIDNLYKRITKQDLKTIETSTSTLDVEKLWEELINKNIIDENGRILNTQIQSVTNLTNLDETCKKRLIFVFNEILRKQCLAIVPNFLISFVENHLDRWIENAKAALMMTPGNDYVVDIDRTGTRNDLHANITILDRDTGTDQASSQWEEGLHQFLQLKHGCRLSLMSLKAVFISNVSYFKLYKNLFGLTGTLGSQVEMDLLREIYGVEYVTIPTSCGKRFEEESPVICNTNSMWIKHIEKEVRNYTEQQRRSVLVICETVENVNYVERKLAASGIENIFAYRREHENFSVAEKPLVGGKVIIATNLAGRGTDIKITETLRDNGGLHICLTYLPANKRVEEQAFGRAARSGDPGSGKLIILSDMKSHMGGVHIINMKKERDLEEIRRISNVKQHYEHNILAEEHCFKQFQNVYNKMHTQLKQFTQPVRENLLGNLIDQWAFWLDKWRRIICNDGNSTNYKVQLSNFVNEYEKFPIPRENLLMPHAIIQGKTNFANKSYNDAISWFDDVINQEPEFCEAAHYYKAYSIGKTFNWEFSNKDSVKKVKSELRAAKRMFERHSDNALRCSAIVNKMKENFQSGGIVQINSYEEQKQSIVRMYSQFITSIDEAIGFRVTAESFIAGTTDDKMSQMIYDKLLAHNVLQQIKPRDDFDSALLDEVCSNYGVSSDLTKTLLKQQKGKETDLNHFVDLFTKNILFPNRDDFWKELINHNVLSHPVKYVIADETSLIEEFPMVFNTDTLADIRVPDFKERIEKSRTEVVKTVEQVTEMSSTKTVFVMEVFKSILKNLDYNKLIQRQLVIEIDVAELNESCKISQFRNFDCLKKADFNGEHIDPAEVDLILKKLVDLKIISETTSGYSLKGNIHQIRNLSLPGYLPLYDYAVRSVLQRSFAYRLAFNRIELQIEDQSWPIKIYVAHKPHQGFFWDLVEAAVINPVVVNKTVDEKTVIQDIYPETIRQSTLVKYLEEEVSNLNGEASFETLVRKKYLNKNIVNGRYSIAEKSVECYTSAALNRKLTLYLRSEMLLRKNTTKSGVGAMVNHLKGFIAALETPEPHLQMIYEAMGSQCHAAVEELSIFTMNGLESLIRFKEKPWTWKMIMNTTIVVIMGLCQLAIGLAIQLFSVGLMTNVGVGFISEGVGDLMFAVSAFRSGYFSWSSYWQHKKESLMFTVVTCGVGALCSRGAQVSRYGAKIAEQSLEVGGKSVANMCGMELIKEVGWSAVGKQVLRDVSLNTLKGVAFGLTSAEVAKFIDNHLQSLCDGMATAFIAKLKEKTNEHTISETMKTVYARLGPKEGEKHIDNLTKSALDDLNFNNTWATTFLRFGNYVSRGIREGLQKKNVAGVSASQNLAYLATYLGQGVDYARRAKNIIELGSMVDRFLDELNKNIQNSSVMRKTEKANLFDNAEELKEFEKTSVNLISDRLQTQTGQIISQKFVAPIMQSGATYLVTYVGQQIKKQYNSYRDDCHFEKLNEEQEQYRENSKAAHSENADVVTQNAIDDDHQKNINELKSKVRNPKLYAELIRDGGHMDMVCLKACAVDIDEKLKAKGNVKGYIIVVHGEKGVMYRCDCGNVQNAEVINVKLSASHFELLDNNLKPISKPNTGYNCMFESLQERIPELENETASTFRENIAQRIETDRNVGNIVRNGWQSSTLRSGLYGGRRAPSPSSRVADGSTKIFDFESSEYQFQKAFDVNLQGDHAFDSFKDPEARKQLKEAYELAVGKINECLSAYENNEELRGSRGKIENINSLDVTKSIEATLSKNEASGTGTLIADFKPVSFVVVTNKNGENVNVPVEWETTVSRTVPLDRSGKKHSTPLQFKLNINVDNPGRDERGPSAPHVGYSVQVIDKPKACPSLRTISGHVIVDHMRDLPGRTKTGMKSYEDVTREPWIPVIDHNWLTTKEKPIRSKSFSK